MSKTVEVSEEAKKILAQWYDREILDDTTVLRGSLFGAIFGLFRQHAVTINGTVHLASGAPDPDSPLGIALLGHEFFHVMHQMQLGWWKYLLRYVGSWRPSHITNGRAHPMERPAYERGDDVWQSMQSTDR